MPLFDRFKHLFRGQVSVQQKRPLPSVIEYDVDLHEYWDVLGELGDGAFGKVEKVAFKSNQSQLAAAKHIEIEDSENLEDFIVEIEILTQCTHENIVGLLACYFFGNKLSMLLEFCAGGAVDSVMLELEKPLTEPQIAHITRHVCQALEFLHSNHVIHRDLKAGNILLTADARIKLADFGVSAKMKDRSERRDSFIGTPYWMAPEVMVCETFKDQPYGCPADIWSLGITLIEMAQMDPPNYQVSPMRVVIKVQKSDPPTLERPSRWSIFFNDFIAKCLVKAPSERYTAADLLTHPFIENATNNKPVVQLLCEKNADILREEIVVDEESSIGGSIADSDVDADNAPGGGRPRKATSVASELDEQSDDVIIVEEVVGPRSNGAVPLSVKEAPAATKKVSVDASLDADGFRRPDSRHEAGADAVAPQRLSKKRMPAPKPPTDSTEPVKLAPVYKLLAAKPPFIRKQEKYFGQCMDDVKCLRSPDINTIEKYNQDVASAVNRRRSSAALSDGPPARDAVAPLEVITAHHSHQRSGSSNVLSPSGQEAIDILDDLYNMLDDDQAKTCGEWITPPLKSSQSFEAVNDDWMILSSTCDKQAAVTPPLDTAVTGEFHSGEKNGLTAATMASNVSPPTSCSMTSLTASPDIVAEAGNVVERIANDSRRHAAEAQSARFRSSSTNRRVSLASPKAKPTRSQSSVLPPTASGSRPLTLRVNADDDSVLSLSDESLSTAQPGPFLDQEQSHKPSNYGAATQSTVSEIVERLDHYRCPSPLDHQRKALYASQPVIARDLTAASARHRPLSMSSATRDLSVALAVGHSSASDRPSIPTETSAKRSLQSDANLAQLSRRTSTAHVPEARQLADNDAPPPEPPVDYYDDKTPAADQRRRAEADYQDKPAKPQLRLQRHLLGNSLDSQTARSTAAAAAAALAQPLTRGASQTAIGAHQPSPAAPQTSTATAGVAPMSRKSPQRATVTRKTRTYVVDGVEVTSTTLHVLGVKQGHELRKKEMQDLKRMQREEARLQQELADSSEQLREDQERKFAFEKQAVHKTFEAKIEMLARAQKKKMEELERLQEEELRNLVKKIRMEQERDLRMFKDRLKQEQKILKQEIDLLSKSQRKEIYRARKNYLDKSHYEREADFIVQLERSHDMSICRTREKQRKMVAEADREFLKQRHALERNLESALWELEERQLSEKHTLINQQFKDVFHLQRTHMLARHQKELEHIKKINQFNEEEMLRALTTDRKGLPKTLRNESKTRTAMFKESLRIDLPNQSVEKWAEKIREFEEKEKLRIRFKLEEYDIKCKRRLAQLVAHNQGMVKELEEIHNEKRNMLVDNERSKLSEYEDEYRQMIEEWKAGLSIRKTALETKFTEELKNQERFYNIEGNIGSLSAGSSSVDSRNGSGGVSKDVVEPATFHPSIINS